jgi:hypothetical protein
MGLQREEIRGAAVCGLTKKVRALVINGLRKVSRCLPMILVLRRLLLIVLFIGLFSEISAKELVEVSKSA